MKTKLLIVLIALCEIANAQWQWAKSAGGSNPDRANSVITDANGNVYTVGRFLSPTITFGSTTLTNPDITGNYSDMFIVKYDANGNVLWAKSAGGINEEEAFSIAADTNDNLYVTGSFYSPSITFGSTTLTNDTTNNSADIFIVKYDTNGNVVWAKSAGGSNYDYATSIATDINGNVFVAGYFRGPSIVLGSDTLTNTSSTGTDMFIVKYDSNGNILWAKSAGGYFYDDAFSVSTDANGNALVSGYFSGSTLIFGSDTLTNAGSSTADIFLAKYDANGNVLWAKSAGGIFSENARSVATDASGNILLAGGFQSSSITFGSTTLTNANPGVENIFIAKYDGNGNALWAKSAGGTSSDWAYSIATDTNGNAYVAGSFDSPSLTFGSTTLTNAGGGDVFIAKYDANGNALWAKSAGGTYTDFAYSVAVDATGNSYVAGGFTSPSITFGSTTLTNISSTGNDMFIAKLGGATGVNELSSEENIILYPNPSYGKSTLSSEIIKGKIIVCNLFGETIYSSQINSNKSEIDLSNHASGIYFLQLKTEQGTATKKIIIKK
jgi:hypothetical protein